MLLQSEVTSYLLQYDYYLPEFELLYYDLYSSIASDFEEEEFQDALVLEFICRSVAAGQAEIRSLRDHPELYPGKTPHDLQIIQHIYNTLYDSQECDSQTSEDDDEADCTELVEVLPNQLQIASEIILDVSQDVEVSEHPLDECEVPVRASLAVEDHSKSKEGISQTPCHLDASTYSRMHHQFTLLKRHVELKSVPVEVLIKDFWSQQHPVSPGYEWSNIANYNRWLQVEKRLTQYYDARKCLLNDVYIRFAHHRFIPPDLLTYPWQVGVLLYSKSPDSILFDDNASKSLTLVRRLVLGA